MSAVGHKRTSLFSGRDVLIHAEQVCGIVPLLDFSKAVVAFPINRETECMRCVIDISPQRSAAYKDSALLRVNTDVLYR
jgi:hypothetical protein